ncbi:hypothetical protein GQ55_7G314300 [Panicum hallii var. hallii]|uniref:Uncharacterized protein n=1 Tax=Panicum hallii var. hallii TaxID=1504633 RepID=A0A2T7D112_9POAL|nr:hypothetical protein GQ55_7G314300 [Panicum hallii var. hallii]
MWAAIWRTRNKMAIEKSFPNHPIDVVYAAISFMQQQRWWRLLKPGDAEKLAGAREALKTWLENYSPVHSIPTDIIEI